MIAIAVCSLALLVGDAGAEVDPDCYAREYSFTCDRDRLDDAKSANQLFKPMIRRHGWGAGCFWVQYIHGDNGAEDTLLVIVNGSPGTSAPACTTPSPENKARAAGAAKLKVIGAEFKKAITKAPNAVRARLLRNTRALHLGDGYGGEAELMLRK
jgi:hypothetical protein